MNEPGDFFYVSPVREAATRSLGKDGDGGSGEGEGKALFKGFSFPFPRPPEANKKGATVMTVAPFLFVSDAPYSMGAGFFMSQMPQGQASAQKPQAMHLSGSTTRSKPPSGSSLRLMAFCGQSVSQM